MTMRSLRWRLASLAVLGAVTATGWVAVSRTNRAIAQDSATTAPSTAPSTSPSAPPPPAGASAVRRGDLVLSLDFDGTFQPVETFAVRPHVQRFQGDFIIKKAVAPNTKVARGDSMLELDTDDINSQITAAQNELKIAQANLAKADADFKLGQQSDDLAMSIATNSTTNAQTELKRWDAIDGPMFLLESSIGSRIADYQVESATDELDQLHKMYKSEDLTSQTADIVVKRAMRVLEIYKVMMQVAHAGRDRIAQFDAAVRRQQLAWGASQQALNVDQLQAVQAQGRVLRLAAVATAQGAVDDATRRSAELIRDRQAFYIVSPIDGLVVYGAFAHKVWQAVEPERLAPGEKIAADQVVMTVYMPGKLRLIAECPETQVTLLSAGAKLKVTPTALSDLRYDATCDAIPTIGQMKGPQQMFDVAADLPAVDERLAPGFLADVSFDAGTLHNVLMVPASAVWKGCVWVAQSGEKNPTENAQKRGVVVGRSDGQVVEIKSGLSEGEFVLTQAKRPPGS
jgi:multidrug resistance efflux pump